MDLQSAAKCWRDWKKYPLLADEKSTFRARSVAQPLVNSTAGAVTGDLHKWETRMLLKHYLDQGFTKAELGHRLGVDRRTI